MRVMKSLIIILLLFVAGYANAQERDSTRADKKQDSTKAVVKPRRTSRSKDQIKPYESVINQNFFSKKGLFTVHQYKDTIYFEIPDSILKRDIMTISRLEKAPAGLKMYAGEELNEKVIQFEKGEDSTIVLRYNLLLNRADTNDVIYKAVERSNYNPVVARFPIQAYSDDSSSSVIDVSDFLGDKNFINDISKSKLSSDINASSLKSARVTSIHAYPINVEISIEKTLNAKGSTPAEPVSLVSHVSFVALPKVPMPQRQFDPRVGYFAESYNEYADHQQQVEKRNIIVRWRLEPKPGDVGKWKRGKLVEPQKPIVIYIDPATPKQWRKYLIMGINDWQVAFEHAGFKNAIYGKEWPVDDTSMHLDDARYSVLHYFPSDVSNAYGPHISDPRSGEIIQTRIGWYHNVMTLLHNWYLVQAAATDPAARHAQFSEALMGQLIRFVSSHEVGHTLGLRHNFGSSSQTPVDSLRSLSYLKAHGHTASIMDYARFNYVAQPEDHIPQKYLFPRIGEYDKWAIEWGYKPSFAKNLDEDKKIVSKWIVQHLANNPRLWFGDGETYKSDSRNLTEDLGDNAMKASTYGIKNLQRILPQLPEWTYEEGGVEKNLQVAYKNVLDQYNRYLGHVLKNIGGFHRTLRADGDTSSVFEVIPAGKQLEAVDFFNKQLFTTPLWLIDPKVSNKVVDPLDESSLTDLQSRGLNSLLDIKRLNTISNNRRRFGNQSLALYDYIQAIHRSIWKDLKGNNIVIDSYARNLQKTYVGALMAVIISKDPEASETDASSLLRADMMSLQKEIKSAIPNTSDPMSKIHLEDLQNRISNLLTAKENQ